MSSVASSNFNSNDFELVINNSALERIEEILKTKADNTFFRISVKPGGCSGFFTAFELDHNKYDDDIIIKQNDIEVVVNKQIANLIRSAELHFSKNILSSYFYLDVKTAKDKCSCGTSFGF